MKDSVSIGSLIGRGATANIYKLGDGKVLKLFDKDPIKGAIDYEYRISRQLYKKGLPVPEVYDKVEYDGKIGIIYEYIDGNTMHDALFSNSQNAENLGVRLAELHKVIHINVDGEDMLDSKVLLKLMLSRNSFLAEEEKRKLDKYIYGLPGGDILCHGDFHLNNILFTPDKAVVIDWMGASKGCPLFDVARTWVSLYFTALPGQMTDSEQQNINEINRRFIGRYLAYYLELSGYSMVQFEQWKLPLLVVRLDGSLSPNTEKEVLKAVKRRLLELPD